VGKESLHREWLHKKALFDLHLIVYDDSYEIYKDDSTFITQSKGQKFKLIYEYLTQHPDLFDQYDYFYCPDDDILINHDQIHRLFNCMFHYKLDIAQPAIFNSFWSYPHTAKHSNSILRYTNFVEIMQPCFSRAAIQKVLFTFNENESGWGIDFHWGKLVNFRKKNMAIIDDVISVHTRLVRSSHQQELNEYLLKHQLNRKIIELHKDDHGM